MYREPHHYEVITDIVQYTQKIRYFWLVIIYSTII